LTTGSGASVSVDITVYDTMVEVTGLTPFTYYTFSVTSKNGASAQTNDTSSSTSTTSATTLQGGEFSEHLTSTEMLQGKS